MTESDGGPSLEMITAALRADSADVAVYARVLTESLAAADAAGIRGKAVTPFLLDYMQRATAGASVAVNLDVARGNIALAGQIATAWAERAGTRG